MAENDEYKDNIDLAILKNSAGICLLKFGRSGNATEKVFYLTGDNHYLRWYSKIFSYKLGRRSEIDFRKVVKIQRGQSTFQFQRLSHKYSLAEPKSLSIMYVGKKSGRERSLDIVCPTKEVFKYVYDAMRFLLKEAQEELRHNYTDKKYLDRLWMQNDKDNSGSLTKREIIRMTEYMDVGVNPIKVDELFNKVDINSSNTLNKKEFYKFCHLMLKRMELETIWAKVIRGETVPVEFTQPLEIIRVDKDEKRHAISINHFIRFWSSTQGESLTETAAMALLSDVAKKILTPGEDFEVSYMMWSDVLTSMANDIMSTELASHYGTICRGKSGPVVPPSNRSPPVRLTICVISGRQMPMMSEAEGGYVHDPYVIVSIKSGKADSKSEQTSVICANGYNPIWNEVFVFEVPKPDSSVLSFCVLDEDVGDDQILGYSSLPVATVRPGLRHVPLFEETGQRRGDFSYASLCVRIFIEAM